MNLSKTLLISAAAAVAAAPVAHCQIVVAAPGVEVRQDVKNIFDQIKYAWEQAQWADKLATLRKADTIFIEELHKSGWYRKTAQAFAVLLPVQSVGVMGDLRTYENPVCLRCVQTDDFMTADWSHLPYELLAKVSTMIINRVPGVNRVVYDVSSKPPATIEWE